MKKILYMTLSAIQILLIVGAYLVQDFSVKRMGMMRHVVFTNQKWEKAYPVEAIIGVFIVLIVVITAVIAIRKIKNRVYFQAIETIIVTGGVVTFIQMNSTDSLRSYYFIGLILGLMMLLQYLKQLIVLSNKKVTQN